MHHYHTLSVNQSKSVFHPWLIYSTSFMFRLNKYLKTFVDNILHHVYNRWHQIVEIIRQTRYKHIIIAIRYHWHRMTSTQSYKKNVIFVALSPPRSVTWSLYLLAIRLLELWTLRFWLVYDFCANLNCFYYYYWLNILLFIIINVHCYI